MTLPSFPPDTTFRVIEDDYCATGLPGETHYLALRPALAAVGAATGDARMFVQTEGMSEEIEVVDLTEAATRCWRARLTADAAA